MIIKKDIVTTSKIKKLKNGAIINRFSHIVKGAFIGDNVMIGEHCYVAGYIGSNTRVQNGNNIWDGVKILSDCFIGPNVNFINNLYPMTDRKIDETFVSCDVVIGAGCLIMPVCISQWCLIGAYSKVLGNVPMKAKIIGEYK